MHAIPTTDIKDGLYGECQHFGESELGTHDGFTKLVVGRQQLLVLLERGQIDDRVAGTVERSPLHVDQPQCTASYRVEFIHAIGGSGHYVLVCRLLSRHHSASGALRRRQ